MYVLYTMYIGSSWLSDVNDGSYYNTRTCLRMVCLEVDDTYTASY